MRYNGMPSVPGMRSLSRDKRDNFLNTGRICLYLNCINVELSQDYCKTINEIKINGT